MVSTKSLLFLTFAAASVLAAPQQLEARDTVCSGISASIVLSRLDWQMLSHIRHGHATVAEFSDILKTAPKAIPTMLPSRMGKQGVAIRIGLRMAMTRKEMGASKKVLPRPWSSSATAIATSPLNTIRMETEKTTIICWNSPSFQMAISTISTPRSPRKTQVQLASSTPTPTRSFVASSRTPMVTKVILFYAKSSRRPFIAMSRQGLGGYKFKGFRWKSSMSLSWRL